MRTLLLALSLTLSGFSAMPLPPEIRAYLQKAKPLTDTEIKDLVTNHTLIGHSPNSHSVYELYFKPDGTVLMRLGLDNTQIHVGKWWVAGDRIHAQWPTYKKHPIPYVEHYYVLVDDVYITYDTATRTFEDAFIVVQGDPAGLSAYVPPQQPSANAP